MTEILKNLVAHPAVWGGVSSALGVIFPMSIIIFQLLVLSLESRVGRLERDNRILKRRNFLITRLIDPGRELSELWDEGDCAGKTADYFFNYPKDTSNVH